MTDTIPPILTKPYPETTQLLLQAITTQCEHTATVMQERDDIAGKLAQAAWDRDAFRSIASAKSGAFKREKERSDKLEKERDEARKDSARIDWLERIDHQKYMFGNWVGGGGTLRAAIDRSITP